MRNLISACSDVDRANEPPTEVSPPPLRPPAPPPTPPSCVIPSLVAPTSAFSPVPAQEHFNHCTGKHAATQRVSCARSIRVYMHTRGHARLSCMHSICICIHRCIVYVPAHVQHRRPSPHSILPSGQERLAQRQYTHIDTHRHR